MSAAAQRTSLAVLALGLAGVMFLAGAAGGAPRKGDRVAPSAPTNVHVAGATSTAVAVAWNASSDNVGVAGYYVWAGSRRAAVSGTSYTVTGLTCAQSATVSVSAFDRAGNRSDRVTATVATAACADSKPPTVPSGFSQAATTQTAVVLTWAPSQDNVGVVGYGVYQSLVRTSTPAQPSVTLSGLTCDSVYSYGVDAADAAGNRSALVTAFVQTAACGDLQPPSAPAGLAVTGRTQQSVSLSWSPSTDDVGVAGYRVSVGGVLVQTVAQTSATVELPCGTSYVFAVEAYDAVGHISNATTTTASTDTCSAVAPPPLPAPDTSPPSNPTGLAASNITQTSLGLTWNGSTDDVGVAGYDVYRNGTKVASVTSASLSQASLSCGSAYAYGVVAYDAAGNRSQEAQLGVATSSCSAPAPSDTSPPSTPTGLAASNIAQTSLGLSWNASTDNVSVTGYDVYRNGAKVASVTSTSLGQSGLTCGTGYTLGVVAYDAAGNRSAQAQLNVATSSCSAPPPPPPASSDTTPPSQPTSLAVSSATGTGISLTWAASTDNVGVTGYQVYVNGSAGPTSTQPGATATGLACGTAYNLEVEAYDAAGNRSAKASVVGSTSACADTQAPTAPANVVATSRTATSIALSWTASTDNVGVNGYGLYRGGTQTGTATTTITIFSGLTCNTLYTLAVDASDAAGNRSGRTAVLVSTTACPDTVPPSAPTNLASSAVSGTGLTLTWNASTDNVGVTGYDVYRNGTKMATVTTTSSSQTGLACGTTYTFAVAALDAAGNASQQAQMTAATSACAAPPPSPPQPPPPSGQFSCYGPATSGCWTPSTCSVTAAGSNTTDLQSKINAATAGQVVCGTGSYGSLTISNRSMASDVTVQSVNPDSAMTVNSVDVTASSHWRFQGIHFVGPNDKNILNSTNITFTHNLHEGSQLELCMSSVCNSGTAIVNGNILIDHDDFTNYTETNGGAEGRIEIRGNDSSQVVDGVVIQNSHIHGGYPNSCSDGIQMVALASGPIVRSNEFDHIDQGDCGSYPTNPHVDPIQTYGAYGVQVLGNYFHDMGSGSGGMLVGNYDNNFTVTNNVFACSCAYSWSLAIGPIDNWTITHNTFAGGGQIRFQLSPSSNIVRDNVFTNSSGISSDGTGGFTATYNVNSGYPGTGNMTGNPIFVAGSQPTTYAGYKLASGSPGKGVASDGTDTGIG